MYFEAKNMLEASVTVGFIVIIKVDLSRQKFLASLCTAPPPPPPFSSGEGAAVHRLISCTRESFSQTLINLKAVYNSVYLFLDN